MGVSNNIMTYINKLTQGAAIIVPKIWKAWLWLKFYDLRIGFYTITVVWHNIIGSEIGFEKSLANCQTTQ